MPERITAYKCEVCGKIHEHASEADECEEDDLDIEKALIEVMTSETHGYPLELKIRFMSGKAFTFARVERCPSCSGCGQTGGASGCDGYEQCTECGGRGKVVVKG